MKSPSAPSAKANAKMLDRNKAERVVIADADGVVVGYAFTGFPKAGGADGGGWRGHFAMAPEVSIKAYALLGDEHMACPLARWPVSP